MIDVEYADAYTEILEILKFIPKQDYDKIPNDMIILFKTNSNKEYIFNYDVGKTLDEQNVSKKAKTIIAILFRDYWATYKQREKILAKQEYDRNIKEVELKEKYNPDNIFKKKQTEDAVLIAILEEHALVEYKEQNFIQKILSMITKFFKR